jgi:hypothetical protein
VRIFKTKVLARFTRSERIADAALVEAVNRIERGIIDADLGGGLIKQRVARQGQGRSGGYRFLIACRSGDRAIFFYGFAKSEKDNIAADDLATAREICAYWLGAGDAAIKKALVEKELTEVAHDKEES